MLNTGVVVYHSLFANYPPPSIDRYSTYVFRAGIPLRFRAGDDSASGTSAQLGSAVAEAGASSTGLAQLDQSHDLRDDQSHLVPRRPESVTGHRRLRTGQPVRS